MAIRSAQILIVDDEPHICSILRRMLRNEGYRVMTASNGSTALKYIKEKEPDVVLLDIMMPGIDGREVCRRAREFSTVARIIYVTAKAELIARSKSKELRSEADGFIAKPTTRKQVLSKISSVLQGCRQ